MASGLDARAMTSSRLLRLARHYHCLLLISRRLTLLYGTLDAYVWACLHKCRAYNRHAYLFFLLFLTLKIPDIFLLFFLARPRLLDLGPKRLAFPLGCETSSGPF